MKSIVQNSIALLLPGERKKFGLLAVANAFISLMDIASLALLLAVINLYTQGGYLWMKSLPAWLTDRDSLMAVAVFLCFFLFKNLAGYVAYSLQTRFTLSVASRLSRNELLRYLHGPYTDYVQTDHARQNHRINYHPVEFAHHILAGIQQVFTEGLLALIAVTAILLFNAKLFLVLLVFLLPPVFLAAWLTKRKLRTVRRHVKDDSEMAIQYLNESLSGYTESNIYDKSLFFTNRYDRHQRRLNDHLATLQITHWIPSRLVEIFAVLGLFLLILTNRYYGTAADIVNIGAFMAAAYKIIPGISRISNLTAQIRTYAFTVESISGKDHITVASEPRVPPVTSICFHNVSFAREGLQLLYDFNARLDSGDFVSISAPSGKGKTTMLNLLLGFLAPDGGEIQINGRPATLEDRQQCRQRIAYVKQQTFLLNDTIAKNITLSEEGVDDVRLQQVIAAAGLQPFIAGHPEGIEKVIAGGGRNISGGQRQRIAIARALYKEADVILLDEPFNELDEASELQLLRHFRQLAAQGKMVLLVSHSSHCKDFCNKTVMIEGPMA